MATARVAPEKAVIRPALPLCFVAGHIGNAMSKNEYFLKLKDPRWQRKRLEVLQAADWQCEACADEASTLHVHHKQYFKGRDPWEYENSQLAALCEDCHQAVSDADDLLSLATSHLPLTGHMGREPVAALVAGFANQGIAEPHVRDPECYLLGRVASHLGNSFVAISGLQALADLEMKALTDPQGFTRALQIFVYGDVMPARTGKDGTDDLDL